VVEPAVVEPAVVEPAVVVEPAAEETAADEEDVAVLESAVAAELPHPLIRVAARATPIPVSTDFLLAFNRRRMKFPWLATLRCICTRRVRFDWSHPRTPPDVRPA